MSWFHALHPLERTAGTTGFTLVLVVIGMSLYSNWVGVRVGLYAADPLGSIGPYETMTLRFSQAVQEQVVQKGLTLAPAVPGTYDWQNDHTLLFIPRSPYPEKVTVHLGGGPIGEGGLELRQSAIWTLTVRPSQIIYLSSTGPTHELMSVPAAGGTPHQLTFTGEKVFDFNSSPIGDWIVYSAVNAQKGLDLWLVDRSGKNTRRLLACGLDRCFSPAWSPDGRLVAYNREAVSPNPAAPQGAPRLRVVDPTTGQDQSVFTDSQVIGLGALWSPDGQWLASDDSVAEKIRVTNVKSGQQVLLPSSLGLLGSWSPDSKVLLYPDSVMSATNEYRSVIERADFQSGEGGIFLGNSPSDETDYLEAVWRPSGGQILLNVRFDSQSPDQQLWLYHPATQDGFLIAHQSGYTYDFPRWDPWGTRLTFQAADLNQPYAPEVEVWQEGEPVKTIARNGMFPQWLP